MIPNIEGEGSDIYPHVASALCACRYSLSMQCALVVQCFGVRVCVCGGGADSYSISYKPTQSCTVVHTDVSSRSTSHLPVPRGSVS